MKLTVYLSKQNDDIVKSAELSVEFEKETALPLTALSPNGQADTASFWNPETASFWNLEKSDLLEIIATSGLDFEFPLVRQFMEDFFK